jgi:RNA polymerase sigma-B factor
VTGTLTTTHATEFDDLMSTLFERLARRPEQRPALRQQMIEASLPFAVRLARQYRGRGEPFRDLVQVAILGFIKAIDRYDPGRGPFSHYAGPTARGELKKHFRDRGWNVRVPRRLQELKMELARAHQVLTHALGRAPSVTDLASHLDLDEEQVIEGMDLAHAYQPVSLNAPVSPQEGASDLGDMLGDRDPAVESLDDRMTLATLLPRLPEREQRILHMRFSANMTQSEIAAEVGISQMHVSRLLGQSLAWLREAMTEDDTTSWPGLAGRAPATDRHALRIELQRLAGGTVLVVVAGEVDRETAPKLRASLCAAAIADRPWRIRTDLAQVPLIDPAGAAALAAGCRTAHHNGADFHLERPRRPVVEVLRQAGLAPVFGLAPSGPTPVRAAAAPAPAGPPRGVAPRSASGRCS